jgi:hypothetical protein
MRVTVAIGALALLLAGVLLLWKTRGDGDAVVPATTPAPARTAARTADRPSAPPAPAAPEDPAGADPQPQPAPLDPSAHPPSLEAPVSKPAPAPVPFTRDETIAKREADLKLLDATRERLERERDAAKTAGNAITASELQIRITRMEALRKQRSGELDRIRAGGALPP